jgi:hypothetical protein
LPKTNIASGSEIPGPIKINLLRVFAGAQNVTQSIWHQVVGDCKTEASARPVPLDVYMAEDLLGWHRPSASPLIEDYVFASESMRGKQPYWPDNLMKRHIWSVAQAIGIHRRIRWHIFCHTFGTLLKANGEDVKTVQSCYGMPVAGSRLRCTLKRRSRTNGPHKARL